MLLEASFEIGLCSGGALRKIMTTPYMYRAYDGYQLGVWKRNNVLFIQTRSHSSQTGFANMERRLQEFTYYGYKFEAVATAGEPEIEGEPPDPNVCYNAVFKTKLNGKRYAPPLPHPLI